MSIVEAKARRLLVDGRVRVVEAGHGLPGRAVVHGDHGRYEVEFGDGSVACPCPARKGCSHALAVAIVTRRQRSEWGGGQS